MLQPKIGMPDKDRLAVARIFQVTLADLYVMYVKLRNFHWNVQGANFKEYHVMFEDQFNLVIQEIDDTAELVRQYGYASLGSMKEFTTNCRLFEQEGTFLDAESMLQSILDDHESFIRNAHVDADTLVDKYKDIVGQNFMVDLITKHMKMAWFIRATLNEK